MYIRALFWLEYIIIKFPKSFVRKFQKSAIPKINSLIFSCLFNSKLKNILLNSLSGVNIE